METVYSGMDYTLPVLLGAIQISFTLQDLISWCLVLLSNALEFHTIYFFFSLSKSLFLRHTSEVPKSGGRSIPRLVTRSSRGWRKRLLGAKTIANIFVSSSEQPRKVSRLTRDLKSFDMEEKKNFCVITHLAKLRI